MGNLNPERVNKYQKSKCLIEDAVVALKCKRCGYDKIGVVTDQDDYLSVKPGMKVQLFLKRVWIKGVRSQGGHQWKGETS